MIKIILHDYISRDLYKGLKNKGIEEIIFYDKFENLFNEMYNYKNNGVDLFIIDVNKHFEINNKKIKIFVDEFVNDIPILFLVNPLKQYSTIKKYTWHNRYCFYFFKYVFFNKDTLKIIGNAITSKRKHCDVERYDFWSRGSTEI